MGFTSELAGGATYFLTDTFGAGVNAAYLFQPATGTSSVAFGLEASYRLTQGVLVSAGLNFAGFQGLGSFSSAPGFSLRFDVKLDERTFGR